MASGRRRSVSQTYISGNTVRVMEPERQIPEPRQERRQRRQVSYRVRRNQEKALAVDLPYVLVLVAAVACVLYICVTYLHVQSSITYRIHNIEALESKLEQLKAENDALETRISCFWMSLLQGLTRPPGKMCGKLCISCSRSWV